jgi:hypothetical protein
MFARKAAAVASTDAMEIDYKHELAADDAKARLEALAQYLHRRHGISVSWPEPTRARFSGRYLVVKIEGELTMDGKMVRFRGEDPGFLWRKKATDYIHGKLTKYLDPRTPVDALPRGPVAT